MTRGLRNNNPLNIRRGKSRWEGRTRVQTDAEFVTFTTMAYGYRAAWKLMETYRLRLMQEGKSYTLENIIHRWAPPEDYNDTTAYIRTVIRLLDYKVAGRQPLPAPTCKEGHKIFAKILAAMTCVECGIKMDEVDRESIEEGWKLAFGKV
ncbi:MAG: structural protein P5 [Bacteroidaceae bacterium]|nr:structural protein P5 [Bacteroidaceae bacterium]